MRKLSLVLIAALATAVPTAVVAGPAHAKPPKPKAELVTKQPAAKFGSGKISAGAFVKNRGNKKAKASVATFYLSTDKALSSNDKALGTARVGKIKPKKFKQVSGVFAVPASVATGTYDVVGVRGHGPRGQGHAQAEQEGNERQGEGHEWRSRPPGRPGR